MNTLVRLSAEPARTRILITQGSMDIAKAVFPSSGNAHPRAMAALLEGLSLFLNERLCVVLCVDDDSVLYDSLGLLDSVGNGERSLYYEVGVAARVSRAERRRAERALHLPGGGNFRDMRELTWEGAR